MKNDKKFTNVLINSFHQNFRISYQQIKKNKLYIQIKTL